MPIELRELIDMIGADRVAVLLGRFSAELDSFHNHSCDAPEATAQAHRLISQAGMLGFPALSQAAKAFETRAAETAQHSPIFTTLTEEVRQASVLVAAFRDALSRSPATKNSQ